MSINTPHRYTLSTKSSQIPTVVSKHCDSVRPLATSASHRLAIPLEKSNAQHVEVLPQDGRRQPESPDWAPTIFQAGPLVGLVALLLAFVQIFCSFAVLSASNGDAVANWRAQPTVYLAIFAAIGNKALAFATVQGTVVTFWLRVLRGSTLGQMHRDWGMYTLVLVPGRMQMLHINKTP